MAAAPPDAPFNFNTPFRPLVPDRDPDFDVDEESDHCRICQGAENTDARQLYHPCKCSGSIKFVHQDCLMRWLARTQRKHCDLCKTPFRFKKVYRDGMPNNPPLYAYATHLAKYIYRHVLVWLRTILAGSVWLVVLPYMMRGVWSFLFWLSDEGVGSLPFIGRSGDPYHATADVAILHGPAVCPASPLFAINTTVAVVVGEALSADAMSLARKLLFNFSLEFPAPLYSTVARLIFGTSGEKAPEPVAHPSLLSEVGFLKNLTRHSLVNRTLISVLEGQLITIVVIISFVLVYLVRDYVVQHQPAIMLDGFGVVDPPAPPRAPQARAQPRPAQPLQAQPAPAIVNDVGLDQPAPEPPVPAFEDDPLEPERPISDEDYLQLYRLAEGDPDIIWTMAQEMNFEAESVRERIDLDQSALAPPTPSTSSDGSHGSDGSDGAEAYDTHDGEAYGPDGGEAYGTHNGEAYGQDGGQAYGTHDGEAHGMHGGEENGTYDRETDGTCDEETLATNEDVLPSGQAASPLRARANTDGPRIHPVSNPLGSNSWSFSNLPDEQESLEDGDGLEASSSHPWDTEVHAMSASGSDSVAGEVERPEPADQTSQPVSAAPSAVLADNTTGGDATTTGDTTTVGAPDAQSQHQHRSGLLESVTDFMWQGIAEIPAAELRDVNIGGFDDDDTDVEDEGQLAAEGERDREVLEGAVEAPLDGDAVDDDQDMDGFPELLGLRGPVAGLFTNAIFCAFLVSITLFVGIFIPYNIGRISLWAIADPYRPVQILFSIVKLVQDCIFVLGELLLCVLSSAAEVLAWLGGWVGYKQQCSARRIQLWQLALRTSNSVLSTFLSEVPLPTVSEIRNFSTVSHDALLVIKGRIVQAFSLFGNAILFVVGGGYSKKGSDIISFAGNSTGLMRTGLQHLLAVAITPDSWAISRTVSEPTSLVDPELAYWTGTDRFWAIMSGFTTICIMAALYLRRGEPLSLSPAVQALERSFIDGLKQASGVTKVILIIGIEMLVFPLYCGMLLDIALLPLFEDATVSSRLLFTMNYPLTSVFVHWFVGTGYMFHFALFVSMCRKTMRKGVLYFIRDPDDPDFHPVRDVLERSVASQLRKILFSALVYGALIIFFLGGVVWGLATTLPTVFPMHFSSNEPVLEFPVDLLFYSFLMPLAAKFFKPSDGLHVLFTWWFRKSARVLRLTWFLFGERRIDEEGRLALAGSSPHRREPWWYTLFAQLDDDGKDITVKTWEWNQFLEGGTAKPSTGLTTHAIWVQGYRKQQLRGRGQLIADGRFVRAPASDQVKIPKGEQVFLEVGEEEIRREVKYRSGMDFHWSNQYQFVYIPPHFRARIFLFILLIWLFAATTGVGITIVPLVCGRQMIRVLIPDHIRTNDVFAFSIGVYALSAAFYAVLRAIVMFESAKGWLLAAVDQEAVRRVGNIVTRVAKVICAYAFLFVVLPFMVSSLINLYAIIPLHELTHTPLLGGTVPSTEDKAVQLNAHHKLRVVQEWTVGLLYLKLGIRIIATWFDGSMTAKAMRAVIRRGWLDPDLGILVRAFILPSMVLWFAAVAAPLVFAKFAIMFGVRRNWIQEIGEQAYAVLIHRLSFPLVALIAAFLIALPSIWHGLKRWRVVVRDEAYLMGEKLQNFGAQANSLGRTRGSSLPTTGTRF